MLEMQENVNIQKYRLRLGAIIINNGNRLFRAHEDVYIDNAKLYDETICNVNDSKKKIYPKACCLGDLFKMRLF